MADLGKEIGWMMRSRMKGLSLSPFRKELMNLQWHPWNVLILEEAIRWRRVTWQTWIF